MSAAPHSSSAPPLAPVTPALLIDLYPLPRCAVHTSEFGTLTLTARGEDDGVLLGLGGGPNVRSLSSLNIDLVGGTERSVPLLPPTYSSNPGGDESKRPEKGDDKDGDNDGRGNVVELRRVVAALGAESLAARLSDAASAAAAGSAAESDAGALEDFLVRSEAAIAEFLSAAAQHRRGEGRGRKRRRRTASSSSSDPPSGVDGGPDLPPAYYSALLSQLPELERLPGVASVDLSDDLLRAEVRCSDDAGREHELRAELGPAFPRAAPIFVAELPAEFEPEWVRPPGGGGADGPSGREKEGGGGGGDGDGDGGESPLLHGLPAAYHAFRSALSAHAALWDELDDLDANAWVLEPSLPASRSSAERRVALRTGLSAVVSLDVDSPRGIPASLRLVGSAKDMAELRRRWRAFAEEENDEDEDEEECNEDEEEGGGGAREGGGKRRSKDRSEKKPRGGERWDPSRSVRSNLEAWLGAPLPSPATTEKSDYVAECGICYAHRLPAPAAADGEGEEGEAEGRSASGGGGGGGSLPDETCPNPSCARSYHESCLFEWLHGLPSARIGFDRIYGTCPYCCEALSVRVARTTTAAGAAT